MDKLNEIFAKKSNGTDGIGGFITGSLGDADEFGRHAAAWN